MKGVLFLKKFISEFQEFIMKGNVMDLAVGVIIGGAFSSIVSSLVKDILMPLLSIILGRVNITDLKLVIPGIFGGSAITLTYGLFLQAIINFLIIAFFIFLLVKTLNKLHNKLTKANEEAEEAKPQEPNKTEQLLMEIRDLLKDNAK